MIVRRFLLTTLLLALTCAPAVAQRPADLVARGIQAYDSLEYDRAAGWLTRALLPPYVDDLPLAQRTKALTFLAATERYRGHPDSAVSLFRRLLLLDPRARPDPLRFPPEVSDLFEDVRGRMKVVGVLLPDDTTFLPGRGTVPLRLRASAPLVVRLTLMRADGHPLRTLYVGPVADSLELPWDGRDSLGARIPDGRHYLDATVMREDHPGCQARVALIVNSGRMDTLAMPAPLTTRDLLPEEADASTGLRSLVLGMALAGAALLLPEATGGNGGPSATRQAVAATFGVGGIIAFAVQRPGRTLPWAVAENRARREAWTRRSQSVTRTNQERVGNASLRIRSGAGNLTGCGEG